MRKVHHAIICLVLTLFCACSPSTPKSSHVGLRLNIGAEPQSLDPRKARHLPDMSVLRMTFEGLMRVNKLDKSECALAEKVEISENLTTYTFSLREAYWSNGKPLLASDFAYSWKKILDPSFAADNAFQLYVIKNAKEAKAGKLSLDEVGIRVIDEHTLQIELENPTPYFLELVTSPTFFPICENVDRQNPRWAEKAETFVSNGPFTMHEWKHQDHLTVKKNLSYWDSDAVKLEQIILFMLDKSTEINMYDKKQLDWAGSPLSEIPLDSLDRYQAENQLEKKPLLGTYFFRINTSRAPFDDPEVRKAFAMVIDRRAIVDYVLHGNHVPAFGLVPSVMGLQKIAYFKDHAIAEAKNLLKKGLSKKGYSLDKFQEITLTYANNEKSHLIAQTVQEQWKEAFGVKVKLEPLEFKIFFDRVAKEDFLLATGSWTADFNDPVNFLEVFKFKKASTNNTHWENSRYIELLDSSSQVSNKEERLAILSSSEALLMDEMPIIPIFHYTMRYLKEDRLKDVVLSSLGNIDFKWAYWDEEEK